MIWLKKGFLDAIVFVLHIYYCFLLEKQILKVLNGDVHGTSKDPVAARPGDQMMGRSVVIHGEVGHIDFLNSTQKHIIYQNRFVEAQFH